MTTELELMYKLLNHNAYTKGSILDLDSLGAGGSRRHLIYFNTQNYLGVLMSKTELWNLIDSIGKYDHEYRKKPIGVFQDEYDRLSNGGKINHSFMYNLRPSGSGYGKKIQGENFEKNIEKSIQELTANSEHINRKYLENKNGL